MGSPEKPKSRTLAEYKRKLAERLARKASGADFGKPFEVDEGKYVTWATKNQPDAVHPRFSAWDNFAIPAKILFALLLPVLWLAFVLWIIFR